MRVALLYFFLLTPFGTLKRVFSQRKYGRVYSTEISFSRKVASKKTSLAATITSHPYVNGRKSFNTTLTPDGALYFHELIVEARNSAFCRTRVAWCIPSSKTYLPQRLHATFHNAPGYVPYGPHNVARESKWRRGHYCGLLSVYEVFLVSYLPLLSLTHPLGFSRVSLRLDDSSVRAYLENHRNINHFPGAGCSRDAFMTGSYVLTFLVFHENTTTLFYRKIVSQPPLQLSLIDRFRSPILKSVSVNGD